MKHPAGTAAAAVVSAEVRGLACRYGLDAGGPERLQSLINSVVADDAAPTTVRDPEQICRDHLADSLVALEIAEVRNASVIADLGAGAGFPGLPLAIALPDSRVYLVESNARKCGFTATTTERLGLGNVVVVHARAEEWDAGRSGCDLVIARALAPLPVIAEYAAPLLRLGGVMLAWRGRRDSEDEAAGARAAAELGLEARPPVHVTPYPGALHRHLHPMVKVADTPSRFPRRTGVARKRPLG